MLHNKFTKKIRTKNDFTELGKLDRDDFKSIFDNFTKITSDNLILKKAIAYTTLWQQQKIKKIQSSSSIIQSYAKGLGIKENEFYATMLIPEVLASFNKWTPNILGFIPGCSSLFTKDYKTGDTIHSRILDYSAGLELAKSERSVLIENDNCYNVFGFTSAGFPIPSISSINEKGLSLAIHYKHGDFFDIQGSSIFEICYDILIHCKNIKEVKSKIKTYNSISHWGIYISDQNNEVASIDIRGNEINFESYNLKDYDYLYFNNKIMNNDEKKVINQPFGHLSQCSMRRKSLENNISKIKPKDISESLRALTYIDNNQQSWSLSPLTISTVQAYSINTKSFECEYIYGESPKFYTQDILNSKNIFKEKFNLSQKNHTRTLFEKGFQSLAKAQYALDLKDFELSYFHLQMAKVKLKNIPIFHIVDFYFNVLEYMNLSTQEDLYYILKNFQSLKNKLPSYLKDQALLFEFRILKILEEEIDSIFFLKEVKNKNLNEILKKEMKLKPFSIKMLKKLIYPKIDILDILYAY